MNPVQYIILDHTLGMSTGKAAAQAAHAAIEGLRLNAKEPWGNPFDAGIVNRWYQGGHYAKVVLETDQPVLAHEYLAARGFKAALIIDEGRTEFGGGLTATAVGCPVLNKDEPHVRETFATFRLYGSVERDKDRKQRALDEFYKKPSKPATWYTPWRITPTNPVT